MHIRSSRPQPIETVGEGDLVKIVGPMKYLREPLVAPLSGRPCACWKVLVQPEGLLKTVGDGADRRAEAQGAVDFIVGDGTGEAIVRVGTPRLAIVKDAPFHPLELPRDDERVKALLATLGYRHVARLRGLVLREGVLEADEEVAIFGVGRWEASAEGTAGGGVYRGAAMRLVMTEPSREEIFCSDDPFAIV